MIVTARLEHFALVTFAADPEALGALLPDGVTLDLPLVSAVAYRYQGLRLRSLPGPRLSGGQVHFRTYVSVGGEHGVWFLATVQDSRWASLPRWLWGMPWARGDVDLSASGDGGVRVTADGVALEVTPADHVAPVQPEVSAPTVGWFDSRGTVKRFEVAYDNDHTVSAVATCAHVARFEALGVTATGQPPVSAFLRPATEIAIHLPPTSVRG